MRHKRVVEHEKQWREPLERNADTTAYYKAQQDYPLGMLWYNWTPEEVAYYEDAERFPILKEGYTPNWNLNHPNWSKR